MLLLLDFGAQGGEVVSLGMELNDIEQSVEEVGTFQPYILLLAEPSQAIGTAGRRPLARHLF